MIDVGTANTDRHTSGYREQHRPFPSADSDPSARRCSNPVFLKDCCYKASRVFVSLLMMLLVAGPAYSTPIGSQLASHLPPQPLNGSWYYHWEDLPYSNGWQFDRGELWKPLVDIDSVPPDRKGAKILWLRLDLPPNNWRDPHLFINSVDLTVQVYEAGQLSYRFGEIDLQGNSKFAGWPWHLVPILNAGSDTSLYFRIYSDYPFIGLSGEVMIGDKADLLNRVYNRGIAGTVFVLVVFIAGVLSTCLGLIKQDSRVALSTGLLSLNLALMMFAENELSQVAYYDPLLWRYIAAFSYFLIPIFLAWIITEWFQRRVPKIIYGVFVIGCLFVVGVAALSGFTDFNFVNAYPYFDVLFILLVFALLIGCVRRVEQVQLQDGLVFFGILALFVSLLLDMLSAHGLITWIGRTGQWGLILFTLAMLAVYLDKDWKQQITLRELTTSLEKQVDERTRELTESQAQLQRMAREDFLTGLLNRRAFKEQAIIAVANAIRARQPLSLLLFDIDFFKEINDEYGHSAGDEVLSALSAVTRRECREGDLICRYGGEEFVLLLHATNLMEARALAMRLQQAIQKMTVEVENGQRIKITASFGLISYDTSQAAETGAEQRNPDKLLEMLLSNADDAMYDVKNTGRNGIREFNFAESGQS